MILDAYPDMKVDVHNPQIRLNVEVREEIYLYSEIIPGPGGMPVGTNESAMLLLSAGLTARLPGIWLQNVVLLWKQLISMRLRTPVNAPKKRS